MRPDLGVLRTRVARRILLLFLLCALLPAGALTVISYLHVREQLYAQSRARLGQVSKSAGMAVYERLLTLEDRLAVLRGERNSGDAGRPSTGAAVDGLRAVVLDVPGKSPVPLLGDTFTVPPVADNVDEPSTGTTVLRISADPGNPRIFLGLRADPERPAAGMLWAEVDGGYLWYTAEQYAGIPTAAGFCVLKGGTVPLRCTYAQPDALIRGLAQHERRDRSSVDLSWRDDAGRSFVASAWQLFMEAGFHTPPWTVVVVEARDTVLAPMASFRNAFLAVTLLALGTVALLSNVQIRRSMEPLLKLREGTRRISESDFGSRVDVHSGDEFEELASSFNSMARRLGAQFNALTMIDEIDRAILSSLDRGTIAATVASKIGAILPADVVAVGLRDGAASDGRFRVFRRDGSDDMLRFSDAQVAALSRSHGPMVLPDSDLDVDFLDALSGGVPALASALMLPVCPETTPEGFVALASTTPTRYAPDDVSRLGQIADQMAVALSNASLVDELDRMSWGALTALARAIDAKSPWTGGHSERVTRLTVRLAQALHVDRGTLETLRRGGLLHDIGKIGIPATILDKQDALTPEELDLMRSHVSVGARILEPVPALQNLIPIVLHHHERYDGTGYPDGLAGETIPLPARILAVADTYDALTSDRPYRSGLSAETAMERIRQAAGSQFDPAVVEALNQVIAAAQEPPGDLSVSASVAT